MLKITLPDTELFDEKKQEFIYIKGTTLQLEHSLISLSKWESRWHKPFLNKNDKTLEETIDYVRCMTLTQNVDPNIYYNLSDENIKKINDYIDDPMTATTISESNSPKTVNREIITSELIYYWMIALNIPVEFQKWHLNRLLMLIRVCNIKNQPPKKFSKSDLLRRNSALNKARLEAMHTSG